MAVCSGGVVPARPVVCSSSGTRLFPTSPHNSSSVPGWMSRHTRRRTSAHWPAHTSPQVHCTATFCRARLRTWQANLRGQHKIRPREAAALLVSWHRISISLNEGRFHGSSVGFQNNDKIIFILLLSPVVHHTRRGGSERLSKSSTPRT